MKVRQSKLKGLGALLTCLVKRAVHIEAVATMETNSFIMALRRMIARRGNIRGMRSDNGTSVLLGKTCYYFLDVAIKFITLV